MRLAPAVAITLLLAACTSAEESPPIDALPPGVGVVAGVASRGVVDGTGADARFDNPAGLATSPDGTIAYVADTFVGTVRRVDLGTGETTTIGGAPFELASIDGAGDIARFIEPRGLAASPDGATLWVSDGPSLRKIDLASGDVSTLAGNPDSPGDADGTGPDARFGFLLHDLEDDGSRVLATDRVNDKLRAVDIATGEVTTLATGLDGPGGLARDGNTLYVADTFAGAIRSVDLATNTVSVVATGLDDPQGVELQDGALYALGFSGDLVKVALDGATSVVVNSAPDAPTSDGASGNLGGAFASLARSSTGVVILDLASNAVRVVDLAPVNVRTVAGVATPSGKVDGEGNDARFQTPYSLVASSDGARVFIADTFNHALRVLDTAPGGAVTVSTLVDDGLLFPVGIALDEDNGLLYIADSGHQQIKVLGVDGTGSRVLAGSGAEGGVDGAATEARFADPWELALGGDGFLYVADSSGNTVRRVSIDDGATDTVLGAFGDEAHADGPRGTSRIRVPVGLAVLGRTLFVTDYAAHTLRALDLDTLEATTVLGEDGFEGFSEGGPGVALLAFPGGMTASADGKRLFIAETGNHVVRKVIVDGFGSVVVAGQAGRGAGLATGALVSIAEATLLSPEDVVAVPEGLFAVGDHAVWRIVPAP